MPRPGCRRRAPLFLVVPILGGCSDLQIDQRDELGMESKGRYELVIIGEGDPDQTMEVDSAAVESAVDAKPVHFDPEGGFTVQIGFYEDGATARDKVKALTGNGYPAYSISSPEHSAHRVRIGYFKSRADADRFGRIFVEDHGGDFWVDLRTNEDR